MSDDTPFTGADFVLGESAGEHALASAPDAADASLALVRQARHSVRMFTRHMDAALYSTTAFADALSAFARRSRWTEVRILVQDPTPAVREHHRLLPLIQSLTSHIRVRRVGADWADEVSALLLADARGVLYRPYGDRYDGSVDFAAGPRALELRKWFDEVWENSLPEPEFRRLSL